MKPGSARVGSSSASRRSHRCDRPLSRERRGNGAPDRPPRALLRGGLAAGTASVAGAAGYLAGRERAGDGASPAPAAVGGDFDLDPAYVNLTTFLIATHPRTVREAIARHRQALDGKAPVYLREAEPAFEEEARAAAAAYLGATAEEVALTDSTTMGAGLVYGGSRLRAGDEVDDGARLLRHARVAPPPRRA